MGDPAESYFNQVGDYASRDFLEGNTQWVTEEVVDGGEILGRDYEPQKRMAEREMMRHNILPDRTGGLNSRSFKFSQSPFTEALLF
ncbi:MAG: hypothetical protein ABEJ56_03195 [Candidatus Nanohaloarchaea archaeon]